MSEDEKKKEETPKEIELPKCTLKTEDGEVICKVSAELYDLLRRVKRVKKITFEVEEK